MHPIRRIDYPPPSVRPFLRVLVQSSTPRSTALYPASRAMIPIFPLLILTRADTVFYLLPKLLKTHPSPTAWLVLDLTLFISIRPAFASGHQPFFEALVVGVIGSILIYSYSIESPNLFSAQSTVKSGPYVASRSGLLWQARCLMKSPDRCYQRSAASISLSGFSLTSIRHYLPSFLVARVLPLFRTARFDLVHSSTILEYP